MKKTLFCTVFLSIFAISCKKESGCMDSSADNYNSEAEIQDGSCIHTQRLTIWNSDSNWCGQITVEVNGEIHTITQYVSDATFKVCNGTDNTYSKTFESTENRFDIKLTNDCNVIEEDIWVSDGDCYIYEIEN